jgi:hypothetical protein
MATSLIQPFPAALTALFGTIDGLTKAGVPVFPGSPGSISVRKNQHGAEYYVRRYYADGGTQKEEYLGVAAEAEKVGRIAAQIAEVKAVTKEIRLLLREGFQAVDPKTYATLVSLHQHGLFAAGATLVGSHAFGVILNLMGFRAAAYATGDVDGARRETLAFAETPEKSFLQMLQDSGIPFVEVPELDSRKASSSFKQRGRSRFHVDLLVPSPDSGIRTVPVPELKAHATALPYLAYLLGQTQMSTLLYREGCCPVRVPVPERFAMHKLVVSQLRSSREAKSDKDIFQAAAVLEALGERFPGAIEAAFEDLPVSARKLVAKAMPLVLEKLHAGSRATEELKSVVARSRAPASVLRKAGSPRAGR